MAALSAEEASSMAALPAEEASSVAALWPHYQFHEPSSSFFSGLETLLDAVTIDDEYNAVSGDDAAMRYWNEFKAYAFWVMREIGFLKEVYDLRKTMDIREFGVKMPPVGADERRRMSKIYRKYARLSDALETYVWEGSGETTSPFKKLMDLHKMRMNYEAMIKRGAGKRSDEEAVEAAKTKLVRIKNLSLSQLRKIMRIPYEDLISKTPPDSKWLLPYFVESQENYKEQWKEDMTELYRIFHYPGDPGNSRKFNQKVEKMHYKYTNQESCNFEGASAGKALTALAKRHWPKDEVKAIKAAWKDAYDMIGGLFMSPGQSYDSFIEKRGPYVPGEVEPREVEPEMMEKEGFFKRMGVGFGSKKKSKSKKTSKKAHGEYQNMMNMHDLYDGLHDGLRPKSHHYRHNNLHGDYLDYSRGDLVPAHFEGYDQQSSSIVDFEAILSVTMLFFIGFAICCIWWLCCAVSGYFLHTKKLHTAKKENDIERQCMYSSH